LHDAALGTYGIVKVTQVLYDIGQLRAQADIGVAVGRSPVERDSDHIDAGLGQLFR